MTVSPTKIISVFDEATILNETNMTTGALVRTLAVRHDDGTLSYFNVYLRINKKGRAVAEISTNSKDGSRSVTKKVTAHRVKNHAPSDSKV